MTKRITERPLMRTPRRNAAGEWRCGACGEHLPAEMFWTNHRRKEPLSYCKPCRRAWDRARRFRLGLDDAWWRETLAKQRRYANRFRRKQAAGREAARKDQVQVARWLLAEVRARGLTRHNVEEIAGVSWRAQKRVERGELVQHRSVVARLRVLHEVCYELPRLTRKHGSRAHPHLAEIARRYQAVREAHA